MTAESTLIDLFGWSIDEDGSFHREGYVISNEYEIFKIITPDGSTITEFDYCNGYSAIKKVNELIGKQ